jgi:hypothetical protein
MKQPPLPSRETQDKPVIWTVSISRLFDMFRDIMVEYDANADIVPLNMGLRKRYSTSANACKPSAATRSLPPVRMPRI